MGAYSDHEHRIAATSGKEPRRFHVVLIRPSKYDDEGYVISFFRSPIASTTLACLFALTEQAAVEGALGADVGFSIHVYDEIAHRVPVRRLAERLQRSGDRAVICLAGVQTVQFPRALDLARQFRQYGLPVMLGGIHVSGCLATLPAIPPEIQEAIDAGITVVAGEVESHWTELLRAAFAGTLEPLVNFNGEFPAIDGVPRPFIPRAPLRAFIPPIQSSFDAGRGCPFRCRYCCIINVQGNTMRGRTADDIERLLRRNLAQGIRHFFLTDDNFARHPGWEAIVDRIIAMREREGLRVSLMIQTDARAHQVPDFIPKLAQAGCKSVFIGLETVNRENLIAGNKRQNQPSEYRAMLLEWRRHGVLTLAGYIIGFPEDTYESVMRDVEYLKRELPVDLVEFFMLTPAPGSEDYRNWIRQGVPLEKNFNRYDGMHVCLDHPRMSRHEWERAFRDAWSSFYSKDHLRTLLLRRRDRRRKELARKLIWVRNSVQTERLHPLLCGILRLKGRRRRSPDFPLESLPAYWWRRLNDVVFAVPRMLWGALELHIVHWETGRSRWSDYRDAATVPAESMEKVGTL